MLVAQMGKGMTEMQRINPVYAILLGGFLLRTAVLLAILYMGPYVILEGTDSLSFYEDSLYIARTGQYYPFEIGWKPYVNFTGFLMFYVSESISLLFFLSFLGWLISAVLIDKALLSLNAKQSVRILAALVMAAQPSVMLGTTLPMREPFQMLGVAIASYSLVKIAVERKPIFWLLAVFGAALSGILHISMFVSSAAFVVIFLLGTNYASGRLSIAKVGIGLILAGLIFTVVVGVLETRFTGAGSDLLGTIDSFRENSASLDARAQYKEGGAGATESGGIFGIVTGFFQYMFMPLPWDISAFGDIFVFLENMLRAVLIFLVIRNLRRTTHAERAIAVTLLAMFFATEFIWSVGTINWGTAARHHVPSTPLLLMACFALRSATENAGRHIVRPLVQRPYGPRQMY